MTDVRASIQDALGDRYEVQGEVGRGGMATVFRAFDRRLSRPVAVKVLHPELTHLLGSDRFHREVTIAAGLQHPNIVTVYESGDREDLLYYTMPLVEGETLRARLARETQLPLDEAIGIAKEIAAALGCAHDHGIVHRDIKPENILLSGGHALVADFGVAKAITAAGEDRLTSAGIVVGTPAYMSPEQAGGAAQLDGRVDIYALGCVLYEMLGGEPPFTGPSAQAVLARQMQEPPRSLHVVRATVSPALQRVIEKALAKVPADRYATAAEFVSEVERAQRSPGWGRRQRRAWMVVAGVAALGLALTSVFTRPWKARPFLDPHKVAGFPLRARGGVSRDVTEQVYTVIENALVHTDPLRWVPGERWVARADTESPNVTIALGSSVARRQGARYWITGSVTAAGDSLSVALELYDAAGDSLVDRDVRSGTSSMAAYALGLRAVNALLPRIVGRSTHVDQEILAGFAPAAVVHWLAGEQAYRESRYEAALALYERALAEDSGMVFAALGGAMSAAWSLDAEGYDRAARLVPIALAHEGRLPRRNALFAHGLAFLFAGDGDSALAWFRRAVAADPGWSEGWYGVGEAYLHLAPAGTGQDSLARDAYSRALALDPDFAPVAFHLAELALLDGRRHAADSLVRLHARLSKDSGQLVTLDLLRACTRRGPSAVRWAELREHYGDELLDAGRLLAGGARWPACARAALSAALLAPFDSTVSRRWSSAVGLHHLAIAVGDTAGAVAFVDSLGAAGGPITKAGAFRLLDAVAGVASDAWARNGAQVTGLPLATTAPAVLPWIGAWAKHRGPAQRLDSIAVLLARDARATGSVQERMTGEAMAAWAALWRADTAAALARFAGLRAVGSVSQLAFDFWAPLALERMTYARLLAAHSEFAHALEVAASFDRGLSLVDLVFLRESLALRREVAARLGERGKARAYADRLRELSMIAQ